MIFKMLLRVLPNQKRVKASQESPRAVINLRSFLLEDSTKGKGKPPPLMNVTIADSLSKVATLFCI